jgi:hypothetical protein
MLFTMACGNARSLVGEDETFSPSNEFLFTCTKKLDKKTRPYQIMNKLGLHLPNLECS